MMTVRLLNVVVGCFARDDDIMHVAFAQARAGDTHKLSFLLQLLNAIATEVAHAGTKSADELINHGLERPAIGHAPLNAFRDELGEAVLPVALALHHTFRFFAGKVGARLEIALT